MKNLDITLTSLARRYHRDSPGRSRATVVLAKSFSRAQLTEAYWRLNGELAQNPDQPLVRRKLALVTEARRRTYRPLNTRYTI